MCSRRLWALGILLALVSFFSVRQDASTWSLSLTKEAKVDAPDARPAQEEVPPHASSATGQVQSWRTESTKKDGAPVTSYRRHIYLDMGANWANTLRLYSDLSQSPHRDSAWEVYAFEANPLIQPYVNKFVSFLNGKGPKPPVLIPPAGSNGHLNDLAKRFHCRKKTTDSTRECMVKLFEPQIHALKVEPELSSLQLIHSRMREAAAPPPTAEESRYTFIPAAVGSEDGELKMTDNTARTVLIRGGFGAGNAKKDTSREYHIPMVDVVRWMIDSFRESDYIVVKMDVEGAEHGILSGLLDHGKLGLIDILAFECHAAKTSPACKKLNRRLDKAAAVSKTKILREASGYQGWDHFSTPDRYYPLDPRVGRPQSNG